MPTAPTGSQPQPRPTRRRIQRKSALVRPDYIPADEQPHPHFGFKTSSDHYLNHFHMDVLHDADQGTYAPKFGDPTDDIVRVELMTAGLLTVDSLITDDGRWYLADRRARGSA